MREMDLRFFRGRGEGGAELVAVVNSVGPRLPYIFHAKGETLIHYIRFDISRSQPFVPLCELGEAKKLVCPVCWSGQAHYLFISALCVVWVAVWGWGHTVSSPSVWELVLSPYRRRRVLKRFECSQGMQFSGYSPTRAFWGPPSVTCC